ncbi:MAG: PorT family protein [Sphingobacteriaceae bacterium]|nr:MAG: PorT family protein [Sphingobacteriaceae bacterium]
MKKIFTTIIIVSGLATAAFSQEKGTNEISANIGYNASTVTAGSQTNSDYRQGFNAGISLDHYFSASWSIKGRLIYDQKGWDRGYIGFEDGSSTITDYKLDYLTVPVLANWHFGRTKNWYLQFGPYVGFLLSAKGSAGIGDLKPYMASTDIGFDLGIGVRFPVSDKTKLFIELNGQGGGSDVFKNNSGSTVRNSVSSVNIGFAF